MLVETTRFGPIEVDEERIISVDDFWVQDVEDGELAFLAVVPWDYFPDYTFTLADDDEFALGVESVDEILVLSIVTVDREAESVSANLLGPLVIPLHPSTARPDRLTTGPYGLLRSPSQLPI